MGIDAPNYNENAKLLSLADKEGGSRDRRLLRGEALERTSLPQAGPRPLPCSAL